MRRALTAAISLVLFLTMSREAAAGSLEKHSKKYPQAAAGAASVPKQGPAFVTDPELMDGFRLLYEQNFPGARAKFTAWSAKHPTEAFGQVSLAAGYLFDEFNRHGVLTSEFFMNDEKFLHGIDGEADPERMKGIKVVTDVIEKTETLGGRFVSGGHASPWLTETRALLTLAAPLVLDLVLFMDLAQRAGMRGVQEWLSFYFKAPMHAPSLYPEHDIFIQLMKLKNTLRWMRGEDLITHLGLEYYD